MEDGRNCLYAVRRGMDRVVYGLPGRESARDVKVTVHMLSKPDAKLGTVQIEGNDIK